MKVRTSGLTAFAASVALTACGSGSSERDSGSTASDGPAPAVSTPTPSTGASPTALPPATPAPGATVFPEPSEPSEPSARPVVVCNGAIELDSAVDADEDGNFVLRDVSPSPTTNALDCPATDPHPEAGGAVVVLLRTDRPGEHVIVTTSPSVTMLAVQDACGGGRETFSQCAELPYYLDARFQTEPRQMSYVARPEEALFVVAGSSTGEPMDLTIVTPALDGERCGPLPELGVERRCATAACDGELFVCGPGSAPAADSALAWAGDDRLSLQIQTSDPDGDIDPNFVRVRLLDEGGVELAVVESRDGILRRTDSWVGFESSADTGVLRADLAVDAATLALAVRCEIVVTDSQGQLSAPLDVPLTARAVDQRGEACDPWGASDACPAEHACMMNPAGERVCLPAVVEVVRDAEQIVNVHVHVPDASPDWDGIVDFYVAYEPPPEQDGVDWVTTGNNSILEAPGGPPRTGWERKSQLLGTRAPNATQDQLAVRFEPRSAGGPWVLPITALPLLALGDACDGARLMNQCEAGTACLTEQKGDPFLCKVPSPPQILSAQWVVVTNRFGVPETWGVIIEGVDPDGDTEAIWGEGTASDGEVMPFQRETSEARGENAFTAAAWFGYYVGSSVRLALLDHEGLSSDYVSSTLSDTGAIVGALGTPCDVGGGAVICEPGTLCTYAESSSGGFVCRDAYSECPEDWQVEDFDNQGAPPLRLESTTVGRTNRYAAAAFRFEVPVTATYDFWAQGLDDVHHALEVRTGCAVPSTEVFPGVRYNAPNDSRNGSGADLTAGDVVYLVVTPEYPNRGAFELFATWSEPVP